MNDVSLCAVPILRIADVHLAKSFYVGFLGLQVDWEHYFAEGAPVYMQVSRDGLLLHLSQNERFRECTILYVASVGLEALHAELAERRGAWELPVLQDTPWGTLQLEIQDPFGNLLRFNQEGS